MANFIKLPAAATLLCVSQNTLRRWTVAKRIPAYKMGLCYMYDPAELEAWVQAKATAKAENTRG